MASPRPGSSTSDSRVGRRPDTEPDEIADRLGSDVALVVADHYGLAPPWFEAIRRRLPSATLMAIDDLADRPLPVEIVLNQNLGATAAAYAGLVPASAHVLAGATYALLRPEFAALRARGRVRDGRIERILVSFGGADEPDVTARAVVGLERIGLPVDVVVGAAYPHVTGLRAIVARQPETNLHVDTTAMADLMDAADVAIGAAGSASWERCALGLPTVIVSLADNQIDATRALVECRRRTVARLACDRHAGRRGARRPAPPLGARSGSRRCLWPPQQ